MYGISFFSRIRPLVHLRGEVLPYIQSASPPGAQTRALGLLELNQLTLRILEDKSHVTYHFYIQRHGINDELQIYKMCSSVATTVTRRRQSLW